MTYRVERELWRLRFAKMLKLERDGIAEYQELLDECHRIFKDHPVEAHLDRLIREEKKHEALVLELIRIWKRQKQAR